MKPRLAISLSQMQLLSQTEKRTGDSDGTDVTTRFPILTGMEEDVVAYALIHAFTFFQRNPADYWDDKQDFYEFYAAFLSSNARTKFDEAIQSVPADQQNQPTRISKAFMAKFFGPRARNRHYLAL